MKGILMVVLGLIAGSANANEQLMQQMLDNVLREAKESAQRTCNDKEFLSCAGITTATCLKVSEAVYDRCLATMDMAAMMSGDEAKMVDLEQCPKDIAKEHGLDMDRIDGCDTSHLEQPQRPD